MEKNFFKVGNKVCHIYQKPAEVFEVVASFGDGFLTLQSRNREIQFYHFPSSLFREPTQEELMIWIMEK